VQRPRRPVAKPLAELIGGTLDPMMRRRGLARAELLAWWPEIVGAAYAGRTAPERIRWPRDGKAATLIVRCDPALSLQLAHEVDRIRERLNGFFGYPAVGAVKIVSQSVGREPDPQSTTPAIAEIPGELEERLSGMDAPLRESFRALARHVLAGS
jgi:hypothetical protein